MPDDGPLRLHLIGLPDRPLLVLDPVQRRVTLAGRDCAITGRAFDLLRTLGARPGQPIRPQTLLATVWQGRVVVAANLRAQVQVLRRALGVAAVQSLGDRGYALQAGLALPAAAPAGMASPAEARPQASAPLIGRDADLAALQALLRGHRLVTVTGPLGVGKSPLARRALALLADGGAAVAVSLDLSAQPATADTATLARAVQAAWPVSPDGAEATAVVAGWLLLDNADHLLGSRARAPGLLAALVQSLLAAAPGLRLLVSAQRPLGLAGEALFRLAPLALPDPGASAAEIRANPAVQWLVSRATAADQRFTLADGDWPAAAAIVHRLDGLPLAIAQAGAQLPLLGAAALADHLQDPLYLLSPVDRQRPGRPGSLREAVARSVAGLPGDAQVALVALAALARLGSPLTLANAAALLRALGQPAARARALLEELIDRSLLLSATAGLRVLAVHRAWAQQALPNLPDATRHTIAAACQQVAAAGLTADTAA